MKYLTSLFIVLYNILLTAPALSDIVVDQQDFYQVDIILFNYKDIMLDEMTAKVSPLYKDYNGNEIITTEDPEHPLNKQNEVISNPDIKEDTNALVLVEEATDTLTDESQDAIEQLTVEDNIITASNITSEQSVANSINIEDNEKYFSIYKENYTDNLTDEQKKFSYYSMQDTVTPNEELLSGVKNTEKPTEDSEKIVEKTVNVTDEASNIDIITNNNILQDSKQITNEDLIIATNIEDNVDAVKATNILINKQLAKQDNISLEDQKNTSSAINSNILLDSQAENKQDITLENKTTTATLTVSDASLTTNSKKTIESSATSANVSELIAIDDSTELSDESENIANNNEINTFINTPFIDLPDSEHLLNTEFEKLSANEKINVLSYNCWRMQITDKTDVVLKPLIDDLSHQIKGQLSCKKNNQGKIIMKSSFYFNLSIRVLQQSKQNIENLARYRKIYTSFDPLIYDYFSYELTKNIKFSEKITYIDSPVIGIIVKLTPIKN